jgi:cytoskeletal protein RodZ
MQKTGSTVGELLREARTKKGLTIKQVNEVTKMSPEVIRALEEDDHSSFASDTYLKGFLKTYATHLGLDANRLWGMISRREGEAADPGGTFWDIEETIREEKLKSPRIFRRFVLPVLIIVIVVLALLLIREHRKVRSLTTSENGHYVADGVITIAGDL